MTSTSSTSCKKWGRGEFWGLTSDFDPDWILSEEQIKLRDQLIELCRTVIRPHAIECDKNYIYPRKSLNALAGLGLLGIIVPKHLGGLGQNHVGVSMVIETIARYGCAALAMVYTMHVGALAVLLFRYHDNPHATDLLSRINKEKLVGTLVASDPATGGHFWYHLSCKTRLLENGDLKLLQYCSWATSAGFADFYLVDSISPDFSGDFSNLCIFLLYENEIRANTDDWRALGLHANQSGTMIVDTVLKPERMIGPVGDGAKNGDETIITYFLLGAVSCWNGLSMACMDLAKKHVTRKAHADVGMRICDYPSIQDYFGQCIANTAVSRSHILFVAQQLDAVTNNNDFAGHKDLDWMPRSKYVIYLNQAKLYASQNVTQVSDIMLSSCGGTGFKTELGLERLFRDARASHVMAPSTEVLRQHLGKMVLLGTDAVDVWEHKCDQRAIYHELNKMSLKDKKDLFQKLQDEIKVSENPESMKHPFQDTDFHNPFNTAPTESVQTSTDSKGIYHVSALKTEEWSGLSLQSKEVISENVGTFTFNFPNKANHSGCHIGQYVEMRVKAKGGLHERYLSPLTPSLEYGKMQFIMKFESSGIVSNAFKALKKGDKVEFRGPSGGFEYKPNSSDELTFLTSGTGVAPALQMIRSLAMEKGQNKTKILLIYYADDIGQLAFRDELDGYEESLPNLKVIYTLGETPENWDGGEGFIDTGIIDKNVSKPNGIRHKIILCGGPTMSVSCLYSLKSLSFPSDMIFIYGAFGTEQVRAVYGRNAKLSEHRF